MNNQTSNDQQVQLQNLYNKIPQSIISTFHTHLSQYKLPQSQSSQIDISTELDEQALNKIIKQILQSTVDQQTLDKVNFDFLVDGKLLRGKLKSHIVRYEISCEQTIEIQYFVAFRQFQNLKESPVEDWISCICQVMGVDKNIGVMSSFFDGTVAFHQKPTKKQSKIKSKIHNAVVKALKIIPSQQQDIYYVISGGIDEQLRISKFGLGLAQNFQVVSINSHQGSVFALDFNPGLDGHFCSVGSQGSLNIWKIPQNFLEEEGLDEVKMEKKKKKKTNRKVLPLIASQSIHKDSINSVCWFNSSTVVTGSSDHSIKLTDVEKFKQKGQYLTKDSITTGIDESNSILFSSHEDGYIRTWDIRSQSTNPSETFKSHSRFASCVKSHPHSQIFATGSYDQTVKIWDTRSVFPLQTIMTNYQKVFTVCWKSQNELVSGGSNPFISFHSI